MGEQRLTRSIDSLALRAVRLAVRESTRSMAQLSIKKGLSISLLSVLGFSLLAVLLELGLRASGFEHPSAEDPIAIWNRVEDRDLRLGQGLHRFAPGELWEPRPGAVLPMGWTGEVERINRDGYRGPLRSVSRKPGVLRIAVLGDSSTFGYGLPFAENFCAGLEAQLEAAGTQSEVLDFGVIGFTLLQGIERYARKVREYRPDVVIAAFGSVNDHHVAQALPDAQKIAAWTAAESQLRRFGRRARESARVVHLCAWIVDGLRDAERSKDDEVPLHELQAEESRAHLGKLEYESLHKGVRRVSVAEFEAGLGRLKQAVELDGSRLLLMSMPRRPGVDHSSPILRKYSQAISAFAAQNQVACFDGHADFRAYGLVEHGDGHLFFLPNDDFHPSRRGHARLASGLSRRVLELVESR